MNEVPVSGLLLRLALPGAGGTSARALEGWFYGVRVEVRRTPSVSSAPASGTSR